MALDSSGDTATMSGTQNESLEDEDLEDGEIASDDEQQDTAAPPPPIVPVPTPQSQEQKETKKIKDERKDTRRDEHRHHEREGNGRREERRHRRGTDEPENRRKKRKKDDENETEKKGKENEGSEGVDEHEMLGLCVRGASPNMEKEIWKKRLINHNNWENSDDAEFDEQDVNRNARDGRRTGHRRSNSRDREIRQKIQMNRRIHKRDLEADKPCIKFLKGSCNKGSDCRYSHNISTPRKMELCKFYLKDCCAKRTNCLYLHEEFPCKFFHTGLKCYAGKNCKFSHEPLNPITKEILMKVSNIKHIETAPKEILGDFPRLTRESAESMVNNTTGIKITNADASKIPSLFDIHVSIPPGFQTVPENKEGDEEEDIKSNQSDEEMPSPNSRPQHKQRFFREDKSSDTEQHKSGKDSPLDFAKELELYKSRQILQKKLEVCDNEEKKEKKHKRHEENNEVKKERKRRHEDMDEEGRKRRHEKHKKRRRAEKQDYPEPLYTVEIPDSETEHDKNAEVEKTPVQVNEDGSFGGIKFKIINRKEIRKSTESDKELLPAKIEKPNEFLSSDDEQPLTVYLKKEKKEIEEKLRIEDGDVERFGFEASLKDDPGDESDENDKLVIETPDDEEDNKFEKKEEKHENKSNEVPPEIPRHLPKIQQELFLRIQSQQHLKLPEQPNKDGEENSRGSSANQERTPSPEPADENWYSSDDDEPLVPSSASVKTETPTVAPQVTPKILEEPPKSTTPPLPPPPKVKLEFGALSNLADLSKVNITELLSSIRQVTQKKPVTNIEIKPAVEVEAEPSTSKREEQKDPRLRDPRMKHDEPAGSLPVIRRVSADKQQKTIYDTGTFIAEPKDKDMRLTSKFDQDERIKIDSYGDVDLRCDADVDFRQLGLPFKPIPVHSAATEIDASMTSHPPISYRVHPIDIPRPDFTSIKISQDDPQVKKDPRLRRLFRINSSDEEQQKKSANLPTDPRKKIADTPKSPPVEPVAKDLLSDLSASFLLFAQLGMTAAQSSNMTNMFDPRMATLGLLNKTPQELELLKTQLTTLAASKPDMEKVLRGPPLLPTPNIPTGPGIGLLGPAPGYMMGMPDPNMMNMTPMGPMGPGPMNYQQNQNFGPQDDDGGDSDMRMYSNRGFRGGGDRRGRGGWRGKGGRDRNWNDSRRHPRDKRDDRPPRHKLRDRDDSRRRRSSTPPE